MKRGRLMPVKPAARTDASEPSVTRPRAGATRGSYTTYSGMRSGNEREWSVATGVVPATTSSVRAEIARETTAKQPTTSTATIGNTTGIGAMIATRKA